MFCSRYSFAQMSKADSLRAVNKARIDSLRAVNIAKADSARAVIQARRDSIKLVTQARKDSFANIRRERELAKKAQKENKTLEVFNREDPKELARQNRLDSLKEAREEALNERKRLQEEQRNKIIATRKKIIPPITQQMSVGYRLASDGWSFFTQRGFIKVDAEKLHTNFIFVDISEKRNPKETRSYNENFSVINPSELKPVSYKYGKINNFYQFKFGYGNSKPISGRLDRKSIVINWVYAVGLSLGILKPYYLDLFLPEGNTIVRKYDKYTEQNKVYFLDLNNQGTIIGGSSFTKGFGGIKLTPGLAVRSGFYFDYTANRKTFLGVEIGASAEIYTKTIPIMVNTKNTPYFFNIYADFRFGKRWQ